MLPSGYFEDRVTVLNRAESTQGDFGRIGGDYVEGNTHWCKVTFNKGAQALREGAIDAYLQVMIRMRWHKDINEDTRFKFNGRIYQQTTPPIISKRANEIQITAQEVLTNKPVTPEPATANPSASTNE